jgi:hypothetical protein
VWKPALIDCDGLSGLHVLDDDGHVFGHGCAGRSTAALAEDRPSLLMSSTLHDELTLIGIKC